MDPATRRLIEKHLYGHLEQEFAECPLPDLAGYQKRTAHLPFGTWRWLSVDDHGLIRSACVQFAPGQQNEDIKTSMGFAWFAFYRLSQQKGQS